MATRELATPLQAHHELKCTKSLNPQLPGTLKKVVEEILHTGQILKVTVRYPRCGEFVHAWMQEHGHEFIGKFSEYEYFELYFEIK